MTTAERAIDPAARLQHALDLSYRQLGRRDRTVLEMRRFLEGRRIEPDTIEQALAELAQQGYLDDARFAQLFAEDRRRLDEWGPERIERRLLAAGIDAETIATALAVRDRGDELNAAGAFLARRFPAGFPDVRDRGRALGMLMRRGYDADLAGDAIRAHASTAQ